MQSCPPSHEPTRPGLPTEAAGIPWRVCSVTCLLPPGFSCSDRKNTENPKSCGGIRDQQNSTVTASSGQPQPVIPTCTFMSEYLKGGGFIFTSFRSRS